MPPYKYLDCYAFTKNCKYLLTCLSLLLKCVSSFVGLVCLFVFWLHGMWDLSFLIRIEPCPMRWKWEILTIGPPRKSVIAPPETAFGLKGIHLRLTARLYWVLYSIIQLSLQSYTKSYTKVSVLFFFLLYPCAQLVVLCVRGQLCNLEFSELNSL